MSVETAREYLKQKGADQRMLILESSSATVELAAQALGCEPRRIAKTLAFRLGDQCLLVVAAGDAKIDNPKYKAAFGGKAKMPSPGEVEDLVGHPPGGVCPFGTKEGVLTYLDVSLKRFSTVFPACGSANSAIEVTPEELEQLACGFSGWVDVCKGWQEPA